MNDGCLDAQETRIRSCGAFSLLFGISAYSAQKPVLSSNEHLIRVGPEIARQNIDYWIERAKSRSTESSRDSKENTVAGASDNGAGGAIVGHAAQGVAAGAVGGAVGSLTKR